jgi:hypothetical protein
VAGGLGVQDQSALHSKREWKEREWTERERLCFSCSSARNEFQPLSFFFFFEISAGFNATNT